MNQDQRMTAPDGGNFRADNVKTLRSMLSTPAVTAQLTTLLGKSQDAGRYLELALRTIPKSPKLLECSMPSICAALLDAAQLQLDVDGILGHAYIVPYKGKAQMQIGYKGLMELARNSGKIRHIEADVVYDGDKWEMERGSSDKLVHAPCAPSKRKKDEGGNDVVIGAYAIARWSGPKAENGSSFCWMWNEELEAIRKRSPAGNNGPWVTDTIEMKKKCPIRRLAKGLPMGTAAHRAIAREEMMDAGLEVESEFEGKTIDVKVAAGKADALDKAAEELNAKNGAAKQRVAPAEEPVEESDDEPATGRGPVSAPKEPERQRSRAVPQTENLEPDDLPFQVTEPPPTDRMVHGVAVPGDFVPYPQWCDQVVGAPQAHAFHGKKWLDVVREIRMGNKAYEKLLKDAVFGLAAACAKGSKPGPVAIKTALTYELVLKLGADQPELFPVAPEGR